MVKVGQVWERLCVLWGVTFYFPAFDKEIGTERCGVCLFFVCYSKAKVLLFKTMQSQPTLGLIPKGSREWWRLWQTDRRASVQSEGSSHSPTAADPDDSECTLVWTDGHTFQKKMKVQVFMSSFLVRKYWLIFFIHGLNKTRARLRATTVRTERGFRVVFSCS